MITWIDLIIIASTFVFVNKEDNRHNKWTYDYYIGVSQISKDVKLV